MRVLEHYTIQTGDRRLSPRAEVGENAIDILGAILREAIRTDKTLEILRTGWYLSACEDAGRLKFRLHVDSPGIGGAMPIRCKVIPGPGEYLESVAVLEVDLPPDVVKMDLERLAEAGDLERCVAWAWLTLAASGAG